MHIEFWFKSARRYGRLNESEFVWFKKVLALSLLRVAEHVNRRFYLFEPNPHCFFALELNSREDYQKVVREIGFIQERHIGIDSCIKEITFKRDTPDVDNNEGFLFILDAMTTYNLCHDDNSLSHIIHCCMNNSGFTKKRENHFYKLMGKCYRAK